MIVTEALNENYQLKFVLIFQDDDLNSLSSKAQQTTVNYYNCGLVVQILYLSQSFVLGMQILNFQTMS